MPDAYEEADIRRLQEARRLGLNWWWRDGAESLAKAFPDASAALRKNLFRWTFNNAGFWYEATARREMRNGKKDLPNYEFGKPFNELTLDQMYFLSRRWPTPRSAPDALKIWLACDDPFTSVRPTLDRLSRSTVTRPAKSPLPSHQAKRFGLLPIERQQRYLLRREHRLQKRDTAALQARSLQREELLEKHTREGWTTPAWFSFNLAEHGDDAIVESVKAWLALERGRRGVPAPARNAKRSNRTKQTGLSFNGLEQIDIFSHLSAEEARKLGCAAAVVSRKAAEAKAEWRKVLEEPTK